MKTFVLILTLGFFLPAFVFSLAAGSEDLASNSALAKNYYTSGDLVTNNTISAWFDRSIDVYGVRLLVAGEVGGQPKVPDEWAKKTAQTFKLLMDRDASGIDPVAQERMIKTLLGEGGWHPGLPTGQRIGYGSGSAYSPNPLSDQGRLSYEGLEAFSDTMALDDMVWYKNVDSRFTGDDDIGEIMEHVLHTLHRFGVRGGVEGSTEALNMEVEESDVSGTELYLAMREAYDNGVFGIEGYGGDIDNQDAWPVMLKEYQYLLTFGMWEYGQEVWENGSLSPEWIDGARTPEGILENNPLGYALFETYFSPVISKPSISALRLIFQDDDQGVSGYQSDVLSDSDGDGVGDNADSFPNDSSETVDTDGDGVGDNADAFPKDASETADTDGDGIGDNQDLVNSGSQLGRAYHMTASTSPNLSEVHIINTSDSAQSFTGTLFHKSGSQLGDSNVALHEGVIEPQGRLILSATDLEQRFNELSWTGPAMLDARGSNQFELMSKLSRNGRVTNTNCVRTGNVHNLDGIDSSDVSYIRFINDGSATLSSISGTLYDTNGDPIGEPNAQFFDELGPREAIFLSRDSISNIVGDTWTGAASLVLSDTYENLKLMNLNFVNDETFFNFSCYESASNDNGGALQLGRAYHMTASTSPNLSEVHIINTSGSAQSFSGTLFHKSGSQLGDSNVALHEGLIEPQGRLILSATDLEQLFNELPWTGPAMLDARGSNQFELMSKLSRNGRVTNTNCARSGNVHNVEGADSPDVTYVRFINVGSSAIPDIRGTLFDVSGNSIGQPDAQFFVELGPREAVFMSQGSISNIVGATWTGEASLVLTEDHQDLRLMNLNFVNDETFFNFSCYEKTN